MVVDQEVRNNRETYATFDEFDKEVVKVNKSNLLVLKRELLKSMVYQIDLLLVEVV